MSIMLREIREQPRVIEKTLQAERKGLEKQIGRASCRERV